MKRKYFLITVTMLSLFFFYITFISIDSNVSSSSPVINSGQSENTIDSNDSSSSPVINSDQSEDTIIIADNGIYNISDITDFSMVNSAYFRSNDAEIAKFLYGAENFWITSLKFKGLEAIGNKYINDIIIDSDYDTLLEISAKLLNTSDIGKIKAKDYYTKSSTGYSDLTDKDIVLYYTDNYNPILGKVEYINYQNDTAQPNKVWTNTFSKVIKDELTDTLQEGVNLPIIIRESWSFEYSDKHIEIVTANNLFGQLPLKSVPTKDLNSQDTRFNCSVPYICQITIFFVNGIPFTFPEYITLLKLDDYYFKPFKEMDINYMGFQCYLNNEFDEPELYPLYLTSTSDSVVDFACFTSFFFADFDNDGLIDIADLTDKQHSDTFIPAIVIYTLNEITQNTFKNSKIAPGIPYACKTQDHSWPIFTGHE